MATVQQIDGDVVIRGNARVTGVLTPGTIILADANISASAGIAASKLQHAHRAGYSQESATNAAAEAHVIHTVVGATGVIQAVKAGSVVAATGNAVATVDVKKNGTSVLTAPITLDSTNTARVVEAGTLAVTALAVGDVLEVVFTTTPGTGTAPQGLFVTVDLFEDAA